jgi:epsilon-lactone hydrolase
VPHAVSEIALKRFAQFVSLDATLEEVRAGFDQVGGLPPDTVEIAETVVGGVPGRWVVPADSSTGTILFFHAGGYIMGSSVSHLAVGAWLAEAAGARVLLLDYRLAPEAPFPAAHDDALAAYRALITDEGVDPRQLVVAGDSAGGGLALATVLSLRDAGDPLPAAVVTMSAFADLSLSGDSMKAHAELDPLSSEGNLTQCAQAYLSGGGSALDPRVSPVYGEFHDFPPMLMQVGTSEVLLDDSIRIAGKARAAGVTVELQPEYQMIHCFQMFADDPNVPEAQRAIDEAGRFIRSAVAQVAA